MHVNLCLELVRYPRKSNPIGELSQNLTTNQTQIKRKRGDQKGNRNACKHGFYSGIIFPEYLLSEREQGLDGILAYVIVVAKIVGNGAKWV